MKNPLVKLSPLGFICTLTAGDVRKIFGLGVNDRLPNELIEGHYRGPRGVVKLYIVPREDDLVNQRILRPHRIFADCPHCNRPIPFGRMHQHLRRKDHQ